MTTFASAHKSARAVSSLTRRRRARLARRLGASLCLGLAFFCSLQALVGTHTQTTVVVVTRQVPRGSRIQAAMLRQQELPASPALTGLLTDSKEALGQVAQVNLTAGQPLPRSSLAASPTVPQGRTVVKLSLASSPDSLLPGQFVQLVTSTGCGQANADSQTGTDGQPLDKTGTDTTGTDKAHLNPTDHGKPDSNRPEAGKASSSPSHSSTSDAATADLAGSHCLLADHALTLALPQEDESSSGKFIGSDQHETSQLTTFALPPQAAITALSLPEASPIIAVAEDTDPSAVGEHRGG